MAGKGGKNIPGPRVPIGIELAAEDRLLYIPLNLEHNRAALRLSPELEHEPGLRLGPDHQVEPGARLVVQFRALTKLHPPAVEHPRPGRAGPLEAHTEPDAAQQLAAHDTARVAGAATVDGDTEGGGPTGEAAESGGVEVECGGRVGGGGEERSVRKGEEDGLGGKVVVEGDLTGAGGRRRRVDAGAAGVIGGRRELQ